MALSLRERMAQSMNKVRETSESSSEGGSSSVYWKLKVDDAGNGQAVIRFLPQQDLDKPTHVESWSYYFKNKRNGNTYSDQASRTYGKDIPDPVSQFNSWVWALSESGDVSPKEKEEMQDSVRSRSQKHQYYSNILVIKDPANPENEGKVFVYRYGKKIYEKIYAQMHPKFEDDTPCVPFDMFEGKNFRLIAKEVAGYQNYDDSNFSSSPTPVSDSEEEIEAILAQCHDLESLVLDKSKISSYEKKLESLKRVMGKDDALFNEWLDSIGEEVAQPKKKAKSTPVVEDELPDDFGQSEPEEPKTSKKSSPKSSEKISQEVDSDVNDILAELGF